MKYRRGEAKTVQQRQRNIEKVVEIWSKLYIYWTRGAHYWFDVKWTALDLANSGPGRVYISKFV